MSNYNFEGKPEGDWDDRGELTWNEFDWQQFLKRHEAEISRFNELYAQHKDHPGHIDEVAHLMGWDSDDWSVTDLPSDEEVQSHLDSLDPDDLHDDDTDPYTLHRHPVFVVIRGLHRVLRQLCERFADAHVDRTSPRELWNYAQALHQAESNAILAVSALDMGDYALAVCQLKFALSAINSAFAILPKLVNTESRPGRAFVRESRVRLFDLREVCLRVMNDCRDELRRSWGDREGE